MVDLAAQGQQVGFVGHNAVKAANPLGGILADVASSVEVGVSREGAVQDATSIIEEAKKEVDTVNQESLASIESENLKYLRAQQQGRNRSGAVQLLASSKINALKSKNRRFINDITLATQSQLQGLPKGGGGAKSPREKLIEEAEAIAMSTGKPIDFIVETLADAKLKAAEKVIAESDKVTGGDSRIMHSVDNTMTTNASSILDQFNKSLQPSTDGTAPISKVDFQNRVLGFKTQEKREFERKWSEMNNGQLPTEVAYDNFEQRQEKMWLLVDRGIETGSPIDVLQSRLDLKSVINETDLSAFSPSYSLFQTIYKDDPAKAAAGHKLFLEAVGKGTKKGTRKAIFTQNPEIEMVYNML